MKGDVKEIYKVYDGKHRELVIPVYQRNYDWTITQCARLFDDLEALYSERRPKHFFGAVVGNAEGTFRWVVIDGQQRLTTVSLLILALTHSIRDKRITAEDPELANKIASDYLFIGDNQTEKKFKLKPVKNDSRAYEKLFGLEDDFLESSNVTVNYRYFLERLEQTPMTADEVWETISKLEVMHLDLEPHDDPQRIFETLNSTGLALSEADKIRNLVLMGLDHEEQTWLYENRWNPIEQHVDYRTDWYIRWYLVTKTTRTPKESDVFEAFKTFLKKENRSISDVLTDMYTYSRYAQQITNATTEFPSVNRRLKRANLIRGDVTLPFLMPVLHDAYEGLIDESDLLDVISIMESFLFRRLTSQVSSNALNKIFATAYNEIRKLHKPGVRYADLFTYLLRRRDNTTGRFPDDAEFREAFESRNFYNVRPWLRQYIFDFLENGDSKDVRDIATGLDNGDLSVEHVMPQNLSTVWRNELGPDAEEIHSTWNNRIANLTVTGYNSTYSNSSFHTKKTMEDGFLQSPYRLNSFIREQDSWGLDELRQRSRMLVEAALTYWPLAETTFEPPRAVLPTEPMGEDTVFTNRVIVSYEFGEVQETVESWADLLPRVIRHLAIEYREELLRFTEEDNFSLRTADSMPAEDMHRFRKVDNSLYVRTHTSTNSKISLLRRLSSFLDLDPDELVFTLRPVSREQSVVDEQEEKVSTYAALTKYLPQFEEARETGATADATAELRSNFLRDFKEFERVDALGDLGGKNIEEFKKDTSLTEASATEILAVITQNVMMSHMMGAGFFHAMVTSGELIEALTRLDEF